MQIDDFNLLILIVDFQEKKCITRWLLKKQKNLMEILPRSFAHVWMICTKVLQLGLAPKFGKILPGQFFKRFCIATWCKNRRPCSVFFAAPFSAATGPSKPFLYRRRPDVQSHLYTGGPGYAKPFLYQRLRPQPVTNQNQPSNQATNQPFFFHITADFFNKSFYCYSFLLLLLLLLFLFLLLLLLHTITIFWY